MTRRKLRESLQLRLRPVRGNSAELPNQREEAAQPLAGVGPTPETGRLPEAPLRTVTPETVGGSALEWATPRRSAGGACTQFKTTGFQEQEVLDLYVGLDFGTSGAKVVVRSPYAARKYATAVAWPDDRGERSFILPTNMSESGPGGRIAVDTRPSPADRSLKVDLMADPDSVEARANAACYLAWVLRTSRSYVLHSQQGIYGNYSLRWTLHLGIPSAGYDDEQIKEGFLIAGKAAWDLSVEDRPPTRSEAVAAVNGLCGSDPAAPPLLDLTGIEVVPEIVAAAATYAQSYERRDGLHFLVDVGASTIDACGFVLHKREGEDNWSLLNALVEPLGALRLHRDRLTALDDAGTAIAPGIPPRNTGPFDPIPDGVDEYLADCRVNAPEAALEVDRSYLKEVEAALRKVIWDLKKTRDPKSPHWCEGLLVFATGGGGDLEILREATKGAESTVRRYALNVGRFRYMDSAAYDGGPTTSPSSNPGGTTPPTAVMARLGVAYGLSLADVGQIVRPTRIDDIKPPAPGPKPSGPDYWGGKH